MSDDKPTLLERWRRLLDGLPTRKTPDVPVVSRWRQLLEDLTPPAPPAPVEPVPWNYGPRTTPRITPRVELPEATTIDEDEEDQEELYYERWLAAHDLLNTKTFDGNPQSWSQGEPGFGVKAKDRPCRVDITREPTSQHPPRKARRFTKYVFPLLRRVFPNLIAHDIVSVQPMTAPIGAIFFQEQLYRAQQTPRPGMARPFDEDDEPS